MKIFAKISLLILLNQFSDSLGFQSNDEQINILSEKTPTVPTTSLPVNRTSDPSIVMCQFVHEYLELKKIEPSSKKSDCMRRKLGIKGSVNKFDCSRNPKPENSIFDIKNLPTNEAILYAENLCEISKFIDVVDAQLKKLADYFRQILKPDHYPCMQYKLHELKPDSPLFKNYNSSAINLIFSYCQVFFKGFQSNVIDPAVKSKLDYLDKMNIFGCVKINMTDYVTKNFYEIGIIAMRTPNDEILDEIKAKILESRQIIGEDIINCYLKYFYRKSEKINIKRNKTLTPF